MDVLHDCPDGDNPSCVRPSHLWLGTAADNVADMLAKGRNTPVRGDANGSRKYPERLMRGACQHNAKLSDEKVREIRRRAAAGESQRALARIFGVAQPVIGRAIRRETWAHVA